jgi:hypothetical protein
MKPSLLFFALTIIGSHALCDEKKDEFGVEWCIEREASLDKNQLRCLRSLKETQMVKDGFADISRRRRTCPKCKSVIVDEDKYLPFSHSPFLVIETRIFTRAGGTEIYLVFKDGPPKEFEAFLSLNDRDINEFGVFQTVPMSKRMVQLIKKLRRKEFDQFWIPPSNFK